LFWIFIIAIRSGNFSGSALQLIGTDQKRLHKRSKSVLCCVRTATAGGTLSGAHMSESEYPAPEMLMYEETLAQAQTGSVEVSAMPHRPTVTEMLQHKKAQLEYQLSCVNAALLKAQQEQGAMELIDAIAKTRIKESY
jgi:hypothetical protein